MTEQHGRRDATGAHENGVRGAVVGLLDLGLSRPLQATDYDTSWALRLKEEDGSPAYPRLARWLLGRQHEDGSWGGRVWHAHDRLLTTLAVVIALLGHPEASAARAAGERYLREHTEDPDPEADRTIGFELIFPALLGEAATLGLDLPYGPLGRHGREREAKLGLLPKGGILTTHTTALFSLEAFRKDLDGGAAAKLLLDNGSMANSPSATACFLGLFPDWRRRFPRSAAYLDGLLGPPESGLPAAHPCDVFVRAWTLYYMQHGGLFGANRDILEPHVGFLKERIWPGGLGFSSTTGVVDSDDTAVALLVLSRAGHEVDGGLLLRFEGEDWFSVHGHESNPSVSANLHILEALPLIPEPDRQRVRRKILGYLLAARRGGAYWRDKWHASVYYPTTRALTTLSGHADVRPTVDWLLAGQRPDGSWGEYGATVEETALVLLALLHHDRDVGAVPEGPLHRAAGYLRSVHGNGGYPELWIGKSLYAPVFAIEAVKIAALALYDQTFGGGP